MSRKNAKKVRAELKKKHDQRARQGDVTRDYRSGANVGDRTSRERFSGKGDLTRKRTIRGEVADDDSGFAVHLAVDESCLPGRVLSVHGIASWVQLDDGRKLRCATKGLLKTLLTEQRHVVATGDRVMVRPISAEEGWIERIERRHGVLSRTARGRQHVLVANVDQLLIVASAAQPEIKPNLIDRLILTAERGGIRPVICVNKIDLVDPAALQPLVGVYGQMGYPVLLVSATTGFNVDRLRRVMAGRANVVAGQSGVGKSSLLNAIQPGLELRVREVSAENEKGKHTTTSANLIPLSSGGFVVDTPGIRQFALWDVQPNEVLGCYRDLRPWANHCRFPDCTHTHEAECAIKDAVADGKLDLRRYDSYCHLFAGDLE